MSTEQIKNAAAMQLWQHFSRRFSNVVFSETSKNAAKGKKTYIYAFGAAFAARINRNAIYSAGIIYCNTLPFAAAKETWYNMVVIQALRKKERELHAEHLLWSGKSW